MIERAKNYLGDKAIKNVNIIEDSLMDMQLAEDRFEIAHARPVFQHLPDPLDAAKEIRRVLKMGGGLEIYDIDDGIFGLNQPALPEIPMVLEKMGQAQAARGGNRNNGSVHGVNESAGFSSLDLELLAIHSDEISIEPFLPQFDPDRMLRLVKMGLLSEQEQEQIRSSLMMLLAALLF